MNETGKMMVRRNIVNMAAAERVAEKPLPRPKGDDFRNAYSGRLLMDTLSALDFGASASTFRLLPRVVWIMVGSTPIAEGFICEINRHKLHYAASACREDRGIGEVGTCMREKAWGGFTSGDMGVQSP